MEEGELPVLRSVQALAGRDVAQETGWGLKRPSGAGSPLPPPPALREGLLSSQTAVMPEPECFAWHLRGFIPTEPHSKLATWVQLGCLGCQQQGASESRLLALPAVWPW